MRLYRTTGLTLTQMQELVRRINEALDEPWNKRTGRPKSLRLYKAVEAACMYLRQNATQEFIGETRDTSQPTISRYAAVLVPLVKAVLEEFVPDAAEAIEIVRGRVVLVDGTLAPCWSYAEHPELWNGKHKTTGFNAQLISLLDGTAVWISGPLPGKTHDAKSFTDTGAAQIVEKSGGGFGDKGYQGTGLVTPKKKPEGGELTMSDKEYNSQISSLRAPVERLVAHFKNWKIFHADYRRPYRTYLDAFDAAEGFSSSQSHGVLNNAPGFSHVPQRGITPVWDGNHEKGRRTAARSTPQEAGAPPRRPAYPTISACRAGEASRSFSECRPAAPG